MSSGSVYLSPSRAISRRRAAIFLFGGTVAEQLERFTDLRVQRCVVGHRAADLVVRQSRCESSGSLLVGADF